MLKIICRYHLDCAPPVFEYRWVNITNRMGQGLRKGWVSISESGGSIQSESAIPIVNSTYDRFVTVYDEEIEYNLTDKAQRNRVTEALDAPSRH